MMTWPLLGVLVAVAAVYGLMAAALPADTVRMTTTNPNRYVRLCRRCDRRHDTRLPCRHGAGDNGGSGMRTPHRRPPGTTALVCEDHPTEPWSLTHQERCGPGVPC